MFNVLKDSEKKFWNENGYLHLKQILSPDEVKNILLRIDKTIERYVASTPWLQDTATGNKFGKTSFRMIKAIERTNIIDQLIDHPSIFPVILDLMGPYLQVTATEIFVRHINQEISKKFHTDSGPAMQGILPNSENLPIQLKVQFFLTDVSSPNSANFSFFPGSHIKRVSQTLPDCSVPEANETVEKGIFPPEAVQLLAKPGDVVIFPWSLWHGVSPNLSSIIRRTVIIRYAQLWCRPRDYLKLPSKILKRLSPRQRRLFGDLEIYKDDNYKFKSNDYRLNEFYNPKNQIEIMMGS